MTKTKIEMIIIILIILMIDIKIILIMSKINLLSSHRSLVKSLTRKVSTATKI